MRILIVSDTHGKNGNLEQLLHLVGPIDLMFHLGDMEGYEGYIEEIAPCPVHMVSGNNDFFSQLPTEKIVGIGEHRIFMVHGHQYGVHSDVLRLSLAAEEKGCDMAFFGHTHRPMIDQNDWVTIVNPGSLSYPRQENRRPSYVLMDMDRYGDVHFTMNYL